MSFFQKQGDGVCCRFATKPRQNGAAPTQPQQSLRPLGRGEARNQQNRGFSPIIPLWIGLQSYEHSALMPSAPPQSHERDARPLCDFHLYAIPHARINALRLLRLRFQMADLRLQILDSIWYLTSVVSFQTSYQNMSGWRDSNPRPLRPERSALPGCATPRIHSCINLQAAPGRLPAGYEPPTGLEPAT